MKFTYNWIKDYVDIKFSPEKLAEKLTMVGLEVVSLEHRDGDSVFEVEITSNRPDWLSVLGIAREAAVIAGVGLKVKVPNTVRKLRRLERLAIEVADKKDCPLYTARILTGVKVAPSPGWLKKRLELIGCRSVNNVVDITNYCLFELGEPLHAFDLDKINPGKIVVRRGKPGEKLVTIDGTLRSIGKDSLVIADTVKPLALAGIMGGRESEVTYSTTNILLEAAVFNPVLIRRQKQAQAVQSESSYRFERGVDAGIVEKASRRAAELIGEVCSGKDEGFVSFGLTKAKEKPVTLSPVNLRDISGIDIKIPKIKEILSGLGFKVRAKGKGLLAVVSPSFRQDVSLEEDLIEEVIRIYGYEHIPASLPKVLPAVTIKDNKALISEIKNILTGLGLNEAVTYSLIDSKILKSFAPLLRPVELMNPLSQEQGVLRTTLIPGLVRAIAYNLNQKQDCISLFECAEVFFERDSLPCEEPNLGLALSGAKKMLLNESAVKDELGMLNLKGIIEGVFMRLGIQAYEFVSHNHEPKADIYINNERIGWMQMLSQGLLDAVGIKGKNVFIAELSLKKIILFSHPEKKYRPLPKYPGIIRDISFILKKGESVKSILSALKENGSPLLRSLKVVDYYKGKQIPEGYRGLTLECVYASADRTLTEEEVAPVHSIICALLKEQFGAQMR